MTDMIIDGQKIARCEYKKLKEEIQTYHGVPTLCAFLVGNNSSSLRYIAQKKKWANKIGIQFILIHLEENISEKELSDEIQKANTDTKIHGIIVQLPLPKHIESSKVIESISPEKDVDGFHPINQGKLVLGESSGMIPCTPAGVMHLIKTLFPDIRSQIVVVIGRSNIVGKPLVNMLIHEGATVTSCNSKTRNIEYYTKNANIIISATGVPNIIKSKMLGAQTTVIDVGFIVVDGKIYGDSDFEDILHSGHHITPVPGGVGPMTVLYLMKNTLKAYKSSL